MGFTEERALDATVVEKIDASIAETFPTLLSLLVIHQDGLMVERYYQHAHAEDRVNVKSVTKSVISALVGIALQQGYLTSLDQRIAEFLPAVVFATDDPRKHAITLKHLLTLRSGLAWNEDADHLQPLFASDNWVQHGQNLPLLHTPGEVFAYSTLDAHLLSAVLAQATGGDLQAFAQAHLFGPLGITPPTWACDPQGYPIGGSELELTPREMAKLGLLYAQQGLWHGKPIIPAEYIAASGRTQVASGIRVGADPGLALPDTYGYLWWVSTIGSYASFYALGYGGQTIYLIPDLDIVLVITARLDGPGNLGAGPRAFIVAHDLAERFVLPALAS